MQRRAIGLITVLLGAGVGASGVSAQAYAPTFATMDRGDSLSRLGGQAGLVFYDDDALFGDNDITAIRFDLYGQFVGYSGLGGYGIIPLSTTMSDGDDESAIGNIEGGLLYVIPRPDLEFVLRAGLTLPTADEGGGGFLSNALAVPARLTDFAHIWPETIWLRLSASPVFRSGMLVLRADAGLDVILDSDFEQRREPGPMVRLNLGGGIDTGTAAILAELVSIADTDDAGGLFDDDEEFIQTVAVSGRFRSGGIEPLVALAFPLDDDSDAIDLILMVGLEGTM